MNEQKMSESYRRDREAWAVAFPNMNPAEFPAPAKWTLLVLEEVDNLAKWCARHGYKGSKGDPLPDGTSARAMDYINADPCDFALRVERADLHARVVRAKNATIQEVEESGRFESPDPD